MIPVTPSDVLSVWERARGLSHPRRALAMTALVDRVATDEERGAWSVGRRDRALLDLRASLFGEHCSGISECPACATQAEITFDVSDLRVATPDAADTLRVVCEPFAATVRLLTARDVIDAAEGHDATGAVRAMLARCVQDVREGDRQRSVDELPAHVVDAISSALSEADPQADVELALRCPHCGHAWNAAFDIAAYLWSEVHAWCVRTLQDIHEIARAYGWCEADILKLSPLRRQAYLDLIRA